MFRTICDLVPADPDYDERSRRLDILRRVRDGRLYDVLPYEFHEERGAGGDYIPLRLRRPSVRYALPRIVVDDSVALLFSEGHFPKIDCGDGDIRDALEGVVGSAKLNQVMTEAALRGSIGSVAILLRFLRGRVFASVLETVYLMPEWDPEAPDTLLRVTERYKVSGRELASRGYDIADPGGFYWFSRVWDADAELWFLPSPVASNQVPEVDELRSVAHKLGFVPIVWIRNLPGGDDIDGSCTFEAAIETSIEIDYQLSQAGRGLKYSSDPTLLIKEPAGLEGPIVRGAANALLLSEKGDAKLLEIGGTAAAAVIEYVRTLREFAVESVHGNRSDASRLSAAASGRALELMNQGLIWLADNLRVSYGEGGLLALARLILRASKRYPIKTASGTLKLDREEPAMRLIWPHWYPPDAADRARDASTTIALVNAGQLTLESAVRFNAENLNILDVGNELAELQRTRGQQ